MNDWTRMLGSYGTSKEAIDQVRRMERDKYRKNEYRVNKDDKDGRFYIEFRLR